MKFRDVILVIIIVMVWGGNFVAAKESVAYFPPYFLLALRLLIVIILTLPFINKTKFKLAKLIKIATTLTVLHFGFMFMGLQTNIDVSLAVVVDQLRVPFAVMLGYFIFNEKVDKQTILGIIVAIIGTMVIVGTPNAVNNINGFWLIMLGAFAWAMYNIQIKNIGSMDVLSFTCWVSILGLPQLLLISMVFEENQMELLYNAPIEPVISLFYTAIFAGILGHGAWYYLLRNYSIASVAPYSLLVPVFGILFSAILLDEVLTLEILIGGLFTIFGVAMVVIKKPRAAKGGDAT